MPTRLHPRHASPSRLPARGAQDVASLGSRPDHALPLHLDLWFAFLFGSEHCSCASVRRTRASSFIGHLQSAPRPSAVTRQPRPLAPSSLCCSRQIPACPSRQLQDPGLCLSPKLDFSLQAFGVFPPWRKVLFSLILYCIAFL